MKAKNIYEFMSNLDIDESVAGIDAVTITATGLEGKLTTQMVLHELREYLAVEQEKKFSFMGARGWQRGSVRYADKRAEYDKRVLWAVLMVTGRESEDALRVALKAGDCKFTRVDINVDVILKGRVLGLARKLKDAYKGPSQVKLVESLTGDTVYFGSRESESYIRIYDKSAEYGQEQGFVWRFELEAKRGRAEAVAEYIGLQGKRGIPDLVFTALKQKSVPTPNIGETVNIQRAAMTLSSVEMKLNWLRTQVRPTVRWLYKVGLANEVSEALQLELFDI